MDVNEKASYRIKLMRDASMMLKKPDRVPHVSFFVTWKILDAGLKLSDAMTDYALMEKIVCRHQELYNFDAMLETGGRNPIRIPATLGSTGYNIDDENGIVSYKDFSLCSHEELAELASDPRKFFWTKAMPRKYSSWNETFDVHMLEDTYSELGLFFKYMKDISKKLYCEYGLPPYAAPKGGGYIGTEFLFNTLRGLKGFSIDMRKNPGMLIDAVEALNQIYFYPGVETLKNAPEGPDMSACFDCDMVVFSHNFMSITQWEKFLWPYLKMQLDVIKEKKMTTRLFFEGSGSRFFEYLDDYPRGMITLHPENDDVFEIRKQHPNLAILGGMPLSVLGRESKETCLKLAKRLVNELGADGGYMMSQDKMGSYKTDATSENLKAVCEFMNTYAQQ